MGASQHAGRSIASAAGRATPCIWSVGLAGPKGARGPRRSVAFGVGVDAAPLQQVTRPRGPTLTSLRSSPGAVVVGAPGRVRLTRVRPLLGQCTCVRPSRPADGRPGSSPSRPRPPGRTAPIAGSGVTTVRPTTQRGNSTWRRPPPEPDPSGSRSGSDHRHADRIVDEHPANAIAKKKHGGSPARIRGVPRSSWRSSRPRPCIRPVQHR